MMRSFLLLALIPTSAAADNIGFLYSGGKFTDIIDPSSPHNTGVFGINDAGQIVGTNNIISFVINGAALLPVIVPGATETVATGINNNGQVTGFYNDGTGRIHGFVDTNGVFTTIDDPLAGSTAFTSPRSINDLGQVVGDYLDAIGGIRGFLYNAGVFTTMETRWPRRVPHSPMASTTLDRSSAGTGLKTSRAATASYCPVASSSISFTRWELQETVPSCSESTTRARWWAHTSTGSE